MLLRWTSCDRAIRFYNRVNLVTNCPNWTVEEPGGQRIGPPAPRFGPTARIFLPSTSTSACAKLPHHHQFETALRGFPRRRGAHQCRVGLAKREHHLFRVHSADRGANSLRPPVASPVAARPLRKLRRERWTSQRHAGNRDQAGTICVIGRRRKGAKRVRISGSGLLSQR